MVHRKFMKILQSNKGLEDSSKTTSRGFWKDLRNTFPLWLMAAPGCILVFIFSYLPMVGIIIAFKNYKPNLGILGSDWVGFENFRFLFGTQSAWRITGNTLMMNTLFIISTLIVALTLAILLDEVRDSRRFTFYQAAIFFPYFISWIVVGYLVYALLSTDDGVINHLLSSVGHEPVRWYSEPKYWPLILTLVQLWKHGGFWSIVYLAGILGINPELFESAKIDGASRWKQITYITLPLLKPIILINILLSVGRIFNADFGLFFAVTRNSSLLYPTTDVIDTFVFRALNGSSDIGMAAAAGLYQAVVGFTLVFVSNWIVRRVDPEMSLF